MPSSKRQFERLAISDEAFAVDKNGRRFGRVSHVGGGGMTITLDPEPQAVFAPGSRMCVTVEEPSTGNRHTLSVEVKYILADKLGVEFVSAS